MAEVIKIKKVNPRNQKGRNKRSFSSGEELTDRFEEFLDHIKAIDYADVPTKTNFAKWLDISRMSLYYSLKDYYPDAQAPYKDMLSDCLTEGAMRGKYDRTITIFTLKNWCDWSDKRESTNITQNKNIATPDEAKEKIKEATARMEKKA